MLGLARKIEFWAIFNFGIISLTSTFTSNEMVIWLKINWVFERRLATVKTLFQRNVRDTLYQGLAIGNERGHKLFMLYKYNLF